MFNLGQAIRRHRETARQERAFDRAFRKATGSDMRAELSNLTQYTR